MRPAGSSHVTHVTPRTSRKPSESTRYGRIIEGTSCGLDRRPTSLRTSSTRPLTSFEASPLRREEILDQLGARLGLHAALHIYAMIQPRMADNIPDRPAHPRLLVIRPKHERPDFREHDRPGALRARLDRHVEGAIGETVGR